MDDVVSCPKIIENNIIIMYAYISCVCLLTAGITAAELGDCEPPNVDVFAPRVLFQILQNPPPTLKRSSDWTQLYNDFISEYVWLNIP